MTDSGSLEFEPILNRIAEFALSPAGRGRILTLPFQTDPVSLCAEIGRVSQMKDLLEFGDALPVEAFEDFHPLFRQSEVPGFAVRPDRALRLGRFLSMIRRIHHYFSQRTGKYPLIEKIARDLIPLEPLEKDIDRVVDEAGLIRDTASPELNRIRREIETKTAHARKRLLEILGDMAAKGYAQEDRPTVREGRLVIPMKQNQSGKLKGLVLDQSASGSTVFIEPFAVAEINNMIRRLTLAENRETERILRVLTDRIREHLDALRADLEAAAMIDGLQARARHALEIDAHPVQISENGALHLIDVRHPLLLARMPGDRVTPLTLKMDPGLNTIVVTGPNAGGKTVALKAIGLMAVMFQHGLLIPARPESALPLFSKVFADIGDRQSIAQDLSTFSSHIANLRRIVDEADDGSLVLLDEIGSATDPDEGAALAMAVLNTLTERGARTLATTHIGALKIFAHETPGVENGSMIFDQETLRPTYRFHLGIPGSSYAFEIAERLGLDPSVIRDARTRIGDDRGRLDKLVIDLEQDLEKTRTRLYETEIKESRLAGLITLYQEQLDHLKNESEERKQEMLAEAEEILREANAAAEKMIREIRESQAAREVIQKSKEILAVQKRRIGRHRRSPPDERGKIHKGDWVLWKEAGGRAEVTAGPDGKGRVQILLNNMRLEVPVAELSLLERPKEARKSSSAEAHYVVNSAPSSEIDLRGHTVEEALFRLDRYLGDTAITGLSRVRIIHGKGTGALRREIGLFLKRHPLVKSQRTGDWDEGDTGVTIVEMT